VSTTTERDTFVSIIIVTYNSQDDIVDCVNSVLNQDYQNIEVIIVDNNSKDGTVNIIKQEFGDNAKIRLIVSPENTGYSGGNNLGFHNASGEMIVILNPDSVVDKLWLTELLKSYYEHEADAGIVCSNVLLFDRPEVINACGNDIHLTGLVFSRNYGDHVGKCSKDPHVVAAPSGASMIFSRSKLALIGRNEPFDSSRFFMEYSDIDLAVEFLKKDLLCYVCPASKILHKYKFKMNPQRMYFLETGRYQLLGHLTKGTLVRMLPALILTELIVWFYILGKNRKLAGSKLRANMWQLSHWPSIWRLNNDKAADKKLIQCMISEVIIYNELKEESHTVQRARRVSDRLFEHIKEALTRSLS
jgi:GT2 family glycosyltransferase